MVTTSDLADGAVTTRKIANNAVTSAKIADGSITTVDIANGTIQATDLAANSVASSQIANGAILNEDISPLAQIAPSKIADGAGSGLVADFLDGFDSSYFLSASAANSLFLKKQTDDTITASLNITGGLNVYNSLTAGNLSLRAPKSSYVALPPLAFKPPNNSLDYSIETSAITVNDIGTYSFYAPLYLPHDVTIKSIKYTAYVYTQGISDPFSPSSSTAKIWAVDFNNPWSTIEVASVTVAGGDDWNNWLGYYGWKSNSSSLNSEFASHQYAYFIEVTATKPTPFTFDKEAKAGPVIVEYQYQEF